MDQSLPSQSSLSSNDDGHNVNDDDDDEHHCSNDYSTNQVFDDCRFDLIFFF